MTDRIETVHVTCTRKGCQYGYWFDQDTRSKEIIWKGGIHYGDGYLRPPQAKLAHPGRVNKTEFRHFHTPEAKPATAASKLALEAFEARWGSFA